MVRDSDHVDVLDNTIVNPYGRALVFVDCEDCNAD
jgi:hypothetical protein